MSDDLKTLVAQEVAKQLAAIAADQTTKKVLEFLKNRNSAEAYVVETGGDSTARFRVWSNGFKECWGKVEPEASPNDQFVTFPLSFSNVPMVYQADNSGPQLQSAAPCYVQAYNVTTTGFTTFRRNSDLLAAIKSYYACGY